MKHFGPLTYSLVPAALARAPPGNCREIPPGALSVRLCPLYPFQFIYRRMIMIRETLMKLGRILVPFFAAWGFSTQCAAQHIELPPGQACTEFGITIDITGPDHRVMRTFFDKNGNPVRSLNAGKGNQFLFTNSATGFTLTVKTGGSVEHITPNANGTETWITSGHELVVLFPTDTPPGPATTLYIGRLIFTLEPTSFTFLGIRSFTGRSIDICAALGA